MGTTASTTAPMPHGLRRRAEADRQQADAEDDHTLSFVGCSGMSLCPDPEGAGSSAAGRARLRPAAIG